MSKETPILFSAPMVRAILDGTKTQTRRIIKPQPLYDNGCIVITAPKSKGIHWLFAANTERDFAEGLLRSAFKCPYGAVGDRLWVRETTVNVEEHGYAGPVYAESEDGRTVLEWGLSPGEDDITEVEPHEIKLRPSIFMKRHMCRILLEITDIRVERLNDITRGEAMQEGCPFPNLHDTHKDGPTDPVGWFHALWSSINGALSLAHNPWVLVIEFKKVKK